MRALALPITSGPAALATIAVVALLVAPTPARADDREDARREFTAGQAADKDHDYANALAHYLRAYDLVPHPFAAFNIAVDSEHLGKYRDAVKWYRQFLELDPGSADSAKVRALMEELARRPSRVRVLSQPQGARVLVDGAPAGATPAELSLKGGPHRIAIEQNGERSEREITTEFGEPQEVVFDAASAKGTLLVYGSPTGATVYVDDQPSGQVPAQLQVAAGRHTLRVQQVGYQEASTEVTVTPAGVTRQQVQLEAGGGADGTGGGSAAPTIGALGYLVGVSGGADANLGTPDLTGDFGIRLGKYEGLIQVGLGNSNTLINLLVRISLSNARVAPFLGASLYYVEAGGSTGTGDTPDGGFTAVGGVRYDFAKSDRTTWTARATVGVGYLKTSATDMTTGAETTNTQLAVPVTLSLEATIGRAQ